MSDRATLKVYVYSTEPWHKWLAHRITKLVKKIDKQDKSYDLEKKNACKDWLKMLRIMKLHILVSVFVLCEQHRAWCLVGTVPSNWQISWWSERRTMQDRTTRFTTTNNEIHCRWIKNHMPQYNEWESKGYVLRLRTLAKSAYSAIHPCRWALHSGSDFHSYDPSIRCTDSTGNSQKELPCSSVSYLFLTPMLSPQ